MKLIPYLHFAVPNLFLESGYHQEDSVYGELTTYSDEDGLEECIRRILIQIPKRFNGRQLRFLRRGLNLSQNEFGKLIDKTEQTVARIEKSSKLVSRSIDLTIRTSYFSKYKPDTHIGEILSIVDEKSNFLKEKIILSYVTGKWLHMHDIPKRYTERLESTSEILFEGNRLKNNYKMSLPISFTEFEVLSDELKTPIAESGHNFMNEWSQPYVYVN